MVEGTLIQLCCFEMLGVSASWRLGVNDDDPTAPFGTSPDCRLIRGSLFFGSRRRVLHVLIKPTDHLVKHVLDRFPARVTMRL